MAGTIHQTAPIAGRLNDGDAAVSGLSPAQTTHPAFGLAPPTFLPRRYKPRNVGEWTGHLTFASDLILALQPNLIVELGTHWGEAYFTFCQTVQEHGLSSLCYAVDHWMGDDHAGRYGEEVFEQVSQYNDRFYRQFSYLLRRSFDEALSQFADDSIALLHIDGLHTYEAVNHDFRAWLPKVSPGGVVLLHDICPRHQDFGVWRLWEEIKSEFPDSFEFHHSWGLGVVRKPGGTITTPLTQMLFDSSPAVREDLRRHYVIYASHLEHLLGRIPPVSRSKIAAPPEIRVEVFPWINGGHSPEVCQIRNMIAAAWNTLVFDLRNDNIGGGPLRIDPGSEPSFIEVGDILVHSTETGALVWSSPASTGKRDFQFAGTALPHPDNPSFIINVGDDPQLSLNTPPQLAGPLKLTVNLRVTPAGNAAAAEMMRSSVQTAFSKNQQERLAIAAELHATNAELDATNTAKNQAEVALQATRQLLAQEQTRWQQIQNSLSWKVTAPMRKFIAALRSGPQK